MTAYEPLLHLLAFFYIYAFLGWGVEIAYHALTTGHLVNRGMLAGPVCPIYGAGMLMLVVFMEPFHDSWLLSFIGATIICTILEFLVGWVLRQLFHTQWWDYSKEPFNISGLICLRFSLAWGAGGTFFVKVVHPIIADVVDHLPNLLLLITDSAATVVILIDLVITVSGILHLQRRYDLLFDIEAQMRETSAEIGSNITEFTLNAQERLEPLQSKLSQLETLSRDDLKLHRANVEKRLQAFDARRHALENNTDIHVQKKLEHFDKLRAKRAEMLAKRPRVDKRFEKAFPNMKIYRRKK